MSDGHYSLTVSQSVSNHCDFMIHLNDRKNNSEHFLVQVQFSDAMLIDDTFMDDIVSIMARSLAKRILGQQMKQDGSPPFLANEAEAKEIVTSALEKMKRD